MESGCWCVRGVWAALSIRMQYSGRWYTQPFTLMPPAQHLNIDPPGPTHVQPSGQKSLTHFMPLPLYIIQLLSLLGIRWCCVSILGICPRVFSFVKRKWLVSLNVRQNSLIFGTGVRYYCHKTTKRRELSQESDTLSFVIHPNFHFSTLSLFRFCILS